MLRFIGPVSNIVGADFNSVVLSARVKAEPHRSANSFILRFSSYSCLIVFLRIIYFVFVKTVWLASNNYSLLIVLIKVTACRDRLAVEYCLNSQCYKKGRFVRTSQGMGLNLIVTWVFCFQFCFQYLFKGSGILPRPCDAGRARGKVAAMCLIFERILSQFLSIWHPVFSMNLDISF